VRVVLDSNVIVSGLRSATGASFRLLTLVRSGKLKPAVTAPLVFEYSDVTSRPGMLPHLAPPEIETFLDWFVSVSSHHDVHFLWRPLLPDPKDDMVLEAAVSARVDYLVTHNLSDFRMAPTLGVGIMTPGQLLNRLPTSAKP